MNEIRTGKAVELKAVRRVGSRKRERGRERRAGEKGRESEEGHFGEQRRKSKERCSEFLRRSDETCVEYHRASEGCRLSILRQLFLRAHEFTGTYRKRCLSPCRFVALVN